MTNVALSGEPRADGGCRVCGAKLPEGSPVCAQCGAVHGERYRCPHCGAIADIEPAKALRYRCKVCGGPRVPSDDVAVKRSGAETPALERAQRAHRVAAAWRVGAGVVGGFGALSLLIALLVLGVVTPGVLGTAADAVRHAGALRARRAFLEPRRGRSNARSQKRSTKLGSASQQR